MTEYDFSPEAYDRYIQTQNRVANWVHQTEQHRQIFEAAAPGAPGIPPVIRQPSPVQEQYTAPNRSSPVQEHYQPRKWSSPVREHYQPRKWTSPGRDYKPRNWASPVHYQPRNRSYPEPERYHRAPPSSSSEGSYVHVAPPQIKRPHPPPPPIYAPPVPPSVPFPFKSHPAPQVIIAEGDHPSSSSSRRHHRSKSHSHPHQSPPPLVTPIYTSPAASPFTPPPPIIYIPSQGYPFPPSARPRPIVSPREQYTNRNAPPIAPPLVEPTTPQTTSSTSTSSSDASTSAYHTSSPNSPASLVSPHCPVSTLHSGPHTSGLGGSHPYHPPPPHQEDQNQKFGQNPIQHRGHLNTNVLPGLEPPYISRNLQYQQTNANTQRCDGRSHPYRPYHQDQSRRSSKSSFQSQPGQSPTTLRPQLHHGDLLYEEGPHQLNPPVTNNGVISISVPPAPRYSIDDHEAVYGQPNPISSSSRTRTHHPSLVVHAPQPMKHSSLLSPRLRASARA